MEGSTSVAAVNRDEVSVEGVCEENLHGRQLQTLQIIFKVRSEIVPDALFMITFVRCELFVLNKNSGMQLAGLLKPSLCSIFAGSVVPKVVKKRQGFCALS